MALILSSMLWPLLKHGVDNPERCLLLVILFQTLGTSAVDDIRDTSSIGGNLTEGRDTEKPLPKHDVLLNQQKNEFFERQLTNGSRLARSVGPNKPDSISDVTNKLRLLENEFNNLKAKVKETDSSGVSVNSVLRMKTDLENSMAELTRRVDDIKQNADQTYKSTIESIVNQLQSLQTQMNAMNNEMLQKFGEVYEKFKKADEENEKRIFQDVVSAIVDGHSETALSKFKQLKELRKYADDSDYVGKIVQEACHNSKTLLESVNYFIRGLEYMDEAIIGYRTFLEEMRLQNKVFTPEIMQVGYGIKELMEMPSYPNLEPALKQTLESMKLSLPNNVRRLLWEDVYLSNERHTGGHLIASSSTYDNDRREVYQNSANIIHNWKFETFDNGQYFYVKNRLYGEYLYAGNDYFKYDNDRRRVFTWVPKETVNQGLWRIEPVDGERVRIKNEKFNEYLYCSGIDAGIRYNYGLKVFTWIPDDNPDPDANWIVHSN